MKKILYFLLLQASVIACFADEYKDPATNVIYTYDPAGNRAEVKEGSGLLGEDDPRVGASGSSDANAEIVILDKFSINGKEYVVDKISDFAFSEMRNITSVVIPSSVKSIGNYAFARCSSLSNLVLSQGLSTINICAFAWCSALTALSLPEGIETIGFEAFSNCSKLESVSLPESVTTIGASPFRGCDILSKISVANGNRCFDSRDNCNAIIETASNKLLVGCKGTWIPSTVITIGTNAFDLCRSLTSLEIPESVVEIEENAFGYCSNLKTISLSEGLKTIGYGAFWYAGLQSITIPSTVQAIGGVAFYSPYIDTITSLIENPFEVQSLCSQSQQSHITLRVPKGTKTKYESTPSWNQFGTIEEVLPADISSPTTHQESSLFDLQGRKLQGKPSRGIYIKDGQKILIK